MFSLVKWRFNRDSKTYLCAPDKAGFFLAKRSMSRKTYYVQFEYMVYQQIVGIPMDTNCARLIADLFLYCYERDLMYNLHTSKQYGLIDIFVNLC